MRSVVWMAILGSSVRCAQHQRPLEVPVKSIPLPVFAQGEAREIMLSPYVGNHGIGERLAQELAAWRDRRVTAIKIVNDQSPGAVLAWVAVNWAQADGPNAAKVEDATKLLAGCLRGVHNWAVPQITVSADAEACDVLAQAAFTPGYIAPKRPQTFSRAVRTPSGIPRLFVKVIAVPPDHEWIGQKGLGLYGLATNGRAASAMLRSP